jgi:hypothetical protein
MRIKRALELILITASKLALWKNQNYSAIRFPKGTGAAVFTADTVSYQMGTGAVPGSKADGVGSGFAKMTTHLHLVRGLNTRRAIPPSPPMFARCGDRLRAGKTLLFRSCMELKQSKNRSVITCSPLKINRCFGGTYRLHLQGRRISRTRYQWESR